MKKLYSRFLLILLIVIIFMNLNYINEFININILFVLLMIMIVYLVINDINSGNLIYYFKIFK